MMDFPLTTDVLLRRAEALGGTREIVSRMPDRSLHRYTYAEFVARTKRLATALLRLGLQPGDRVATLCWNHYAHLEAYFGIPLAGGVLHTLNLRLHHDDLAYIVSHAGDRFLIVDATLLPLFEKFRGQVAIETLIVVGGGAALPDGALDYEQLVTSTEPAASFPEKDEHDAMAMCYTSGTTGRPKGVVYTHRSTVLHSMGISMGDTLALRQADVVLPVVPMFHANAWGLPHACVMALSKMVLPGPFLDPPSVVDLIEAERVTYAAGVPTVWMGLLQLLDSQPGARDLSCVRGLLVGGSAAPRAMIEGFEKRHGLAVMHAWGMTETSPLGSTSSLTAEIAAAPDEVRFAHQATQGRPAPFVEIRAQSAEGLVPWDGQTMGELEVRGPWVAASYYKQEGRDDRFTRDGWFRTGDIVTIDPSGYIAIQDRAKDLIKSGGEWISSVALENALMGHPDVAEAAVIAFKHPKWDERPLGVVVLKPGAQPDSEALRTYLSERVAKWWVPDAIEFVDAIPRTSVGKFMKAALRDRFKEYGVK
jgi:fatty-acyl-CoA synthase